MLKEKLQDLSKEALRNKDMETRKMLGSILSRFTEAEKAGGFKGWTVEAEEDVIRGHIKSLQKSIDSMPGTPLAASYAHEIDVLSGFLPRMLDEAATRELAAPYAARANGKIGPFMGMVLKDHKGQVDANLLRKIGQELGLS